MEAQLSIKILRSLAELEEVRAAWEAWPGNRDSEMQTYLSCLRLNRNTERPHVLVVYRDGRADAILIGRIDNDQVRCRFGYFCAAFPARIMCFVYGALRGNASEENCDLLVSSIMVSLAEGEADVAYLNFLRRDSSLCRIASSKPQVVCRDHVSATQRHFAAALPSTVDDFYKMLSPKARKNQKWQAKKLMSHFGGDVRIQCFQQPEEVDLLMQNVEQVASTSYQRGLGVGFHNNPETREQLQLKAKNGWLRGYVLYLAGQPRAFWIGDMNDGTFGSDYIGYDAEFASHSPGMYLAVKVIEGFCDGNREGVTAVDFSPGHAQYKEVLSNQEWEECGIHIFAPTFKGVSLNTVRTFVGGADRSAKNLLSSLNLLQRIKKSWRTKVMLKQAMQS